MLTRMTRRGLVLGAGAMALLGTPAQALPFDGGWTHQTFPRRKANAYAQQGATLQVESDQGVSLLIRAVPEGQWGARAASWRWAVDEGVPATDLARKGGDDRNLALYFAFMPRADAERLVGAAPRRVLTDKAARTLVYVWGGQGRRGQMLESPYMGARGRTVVLRPSGTGAHQESVDLAGDYARAFGQAPDVLFGIAVSADSDDTAVRIRARIESLRLS